MNPHGAVIHIIEEEQEGGWLFKVIITSADGPSTEHRVTLKEADYRWLTGGKITPKQLVKRSFAFLLEREPQEAILREFDLMVISRYFPEYAEEIERYLGSHP